MHPCLQSFVLAFIPLFVAIDPLGLVAIFLGLGGHVDAKRRQIEGTLGLITSLAVSIGFIFLGKIIFRALGITVSDFQVAGGLILLGIAVIPRDRKSTRLNSSHRCISYAVFCLKK